MIDFKEGPIKIAGHVGLGNLPTLACGTWNGISMDAMGEEELAAIIGRITTLKEEKFHGA